MGLTWSPGGLGLKRGKRGDRFKCSHAAVALDPSCPLKALFMADIIQFFPRHEIFFLGGIRV